MNEYIKRWNRAYKRKQENVHLRKAVLKISSPYHLSTLPHNSTSISGWGLFSHTQQADGWPISVTSLTFFFFSFFFWVAAVRRVEGCPAPTSCWLSLNPHHVPQSSLLTSCFFSPKKAIHRSYTWCSVEHKGENISRDVVPLLTSGMWKMAICVSK